MLPSAIEQARAAVAIDRDDAWPRLAFGYVLQFQRLSEDSEEELRAALDLNPNFAVAHACLALTLAFAGRGREAIAVIDRAMQLSPHDPFSSLFAAARAFSSYMAEDYSGGLEWARRAVRMNPDLAGYWRPRALCAAALGLDEEARGLSQR